MRLSIGSISSQETVARIPVHSERDDALAKLKMTERALAELQAEKEKDEAELDRFRMAAFEAEMDAMAGLSGYVNT
jgi:hypothetical protein